MFDLTKNPFHLLGAPLDASAEDIVDLTQDAVFDGRTDEAAAARAQQTLIPPRSRLDAEVGWFADVPSETVPKLAKFVLGGELDAAIAALEAVAPLARANAAAHLCGRFPDSAPPLSLIVDAWNDLDRSETFQAIVAARRRAGFPRPDPEHFDEALRKLEAAHARQAVRSIEAMTAPGSALSDMVESAIGRQALGPMLRRIVREYDKSSEPRLEAVREEIAAETQRCRADPDTAAEVVERLRELLSDWDDINQPVQLLEQAEGHEEERSRRLSQELRDLGLWLANDQLKHREALVLTRALLETFPELDSVAAQLRQDVRVLEDIVRRLPPSPAPRPRSRPLQSQPSAPRPQANPGKPSVASHHEATSGKRAAFWIVACVVGGIIWLAMLDQPTSRPSPPSTSSTVRPSVPPTTSAQPARPPAPAATASTPAETRPPISPGRALTTPEIRYCVFQRARIDHLDAMLSSPNQNEINQFNALVRDYNSRCGRFTYRSGALAPVEADARRRDAELRREASQILAGWRSASAPRAMPQPQVAPPPPAVPSARAPSTGAPSTGTTTFRPAPATVPSSPPVLAPQPPRLLDLRNADDARIVQRRLQELGYYQAAIDGGFGPLSVAALRAFKRNHPRLPADAEWDIETQRALLNQ